MCVIVYKPETAKVDIAFFNVCWDKNPHGGGFAYWDGQDWVVKKGYMEKEEFYTAVEHYLEFGIDLVLHFRRDLERKRPKPDFTHPHELTLSDTTAFVFYNGGASIYLKSLLAGEEKTGIMKFVELLSKLNFTKEQYERFIELDLYKPFLDGRIFTIYKGEKLPFYAGPWVKYGDLLLSRDVLNEE